MDLKNIDIKKLFVHKNTPKYSFGVYAPHRDWKIVVSIVFVLIILILGASLYLWNKIRHEDIFAFDGELNTTKEVINQELLDKTLNNFNEKAKNKDAFPRRPSLIVDPSK